MNGHQTHQQAVCGHQTDQQAVNGHQTHQQAVCGHQTHQQAVCGYKMSPCMHDFASSNVGEVKHCLNSINMSDK